MPQFDPRREPIRFAPAVAAVTLAVCVAGVTMGTRADPAGPKAKPAATASKAAPAKSSKTGAKPAAKVAAKVETKAGAKVEAEAAPKKSAKAAPAKSDAKAAKPASKLATNDKSDAKRSVEKPEAVPVKSQVESKKAKAAKLEIADSAPAPIVKAPTYGAAQIIKVKVRKGETLDAAIRRAEAAPEDAKAAAAQVEKALGAPVKAGQLFAIEVAPRAGRVGAGKLLKLTLKVPSADPVVLSRGPEGRMALAKRAGPVGEIKGLEIQETGAGPARARLISGEVKGSLFQSARSAGVSSGQIGEIVRVFAAKLDFQRDLKKGDRFSVVYDHKGQLIYARIKAKGSYRFARSGGQVLWLDEDGRSLKAGLLRTPVDGARMSSRFGMRTHPIFGYARMHQGIDFAAASGTPIMAAGDGTVVRMDRWGGYGNWLQIRHSGGYESGYAHLSRYASGLKVGDKVNQGQLVAYVGSTGASTGPHLHHEIWLNGKRVDPRGAKIPQGFALQGRELVAFEAQRARVQAALNDAKPQLGSKDREKVAGLRPSKDADAA